MQKIGTFLPSHRHLPCLLRPWTIAFNPFVPPGREPRVAVTPNHYSCAM